MRLSGQIALAALAVVSVCEVAAAETKFEAGRRAYALMEAGAEYCPNLENTWTAGAMVMEGYSYDPLVNDAEIHRLLAEKQKFFETFRSVPRAIVCEMLMQEFGPGGRLHLFQFR